MTAALCLSCGEIKSGALNPCPICTASTTGNIDLDILFSDHHFPAKTLEAFGSVIHTINVATDDQNLRFWAFMHHVTINYPDVITVELRPEIQTEVKALVKQLVFPKII